MQFEEENEREFASEKLEKVLNITRFHAVYRYVKSITHETLFPFALHGISTKFLNISHVLQNSFFTTQAFISLIKTSIFLYSYLKINSPDSNHYQKYSLLVV